MAEPERIVRRGLGAPIRRRWHQGESEDAAAPLPGYLCEACLDAPAVTLVPAPGGGELALCQACQQHQAATRDTSERIPDE
jgi:hypothetical protein